MRAPAVSLSSRVLTPNSPIPCTGQPCRFLLSFAVSRLIFGGKQMYAVTSIFPGEDAKMRKPTRSPTPNPTCPLFRNDDKTVTDYKVVGGSVLHLVLALRGGCRA